MNSTDLTRHSEKQLLSAPVLVIGGIAAGLLLPFLFKKKRALPADPPPIFIKSGSFDIASNEELNESGGSGSTPFIYTWDDANSGVFEEIVGVRVTVINDKTGQIYSRDIEHPSGIEVKIKLEEKVSGGTWQEIDPAIIRSEPPSRKNFVLRIKKELPEDTPNPPKKGKRRKERLRFTRVVVKKIGAEEIPFPPNGPANEDDVFYIGIYNRLV